MRSRLHILLLAGLALFVFAKANAEDVVRKTDAVVFGHVVSNGEHLPYVKVFVRGTNIGTMTDKTGHYRLLDLPVGHHVIEAQLIGYKTQMQTIDIKANQTIEVNFTMPEDMLDIERVVVTGDKQALTRREASTIVSALSPKLLQRQNASTISEGLSYIPGVRMENNCQNCGFNQVRLNGLEGSYSQILIDGRPIFTGLMGVYGLEMIPANMIDRIEVQRGGGSALYGSNAIAGTVNVILQDPMANTFNLGYNQGFTGLFNNNNQGIQPDWDVSFNASAVTDNNKNGLSLYGNYRSREAYDMTNDGFSEIPRLKNGTLGTRAFRRFGERGKLSLTYFHINEDRRGGNKFDGEEHMADIAEALRHNINSGSLLYTQLFRQEDQLSVSLSMQHVRRHSYYGGNSLADYGLTTDLAYNVSTQYVAKFGPEMLNQNLIAGIDFTGEDMVDKKLGYIKSGTLGYYSYDRQSNGDIDTVYHPGELDPNKPNVVEPDRITSNQRSSTYGGYAQYRITYNIATLTLGARLDHYIVKNRDNNDVTSGTVPVPRVSILVSPMPELQLRANYAMGYRAPQVFNEDLHVETSGATRIFQKNSPDLKRETSHSASLSLDYNRQMENWAVGFTAEGFYTRLQDAFINTRNESNSGVVTNIRGNDPNGAHIYGTNLEMNMAFRMGLTMKIGGTLQKSEYLKKPDPDTNGGEKAFLRTPNGYGFFMFDYRIWRGLSLNGSLYITGPMLIQYADGKAFRNTAEEVMDQKGIPIIRKTPTFLDLGMRLSYTFKLAEVDVTVYCGMKNIANAYQPDLEQGAERASAYVYGPMLPRTGYFGIRFGNVF